MMPDDIITRDIEGQLAVNTVSSTEANVPYNYDDCFTVDINGRRAVRVVGGAGAIDDNKIIIKSEEIPTASADELGKFYCYSGETNSSFAHGYVYECVAGSTTYDDSVTFEPATLSGTVVTATAGALATLAATYIVGDITTITNGTMTFDAAGELWVFVGKDTENNTVGHFQIYQQDYVDAGFTFTGTPQDGDVIAFTCSISESTSYSWERIDLQPAAKLGRYLSGWNCATGLATTNPQESPYEYTTGDYFIVSAVAAAGGTNYRPNGSSYVIGQASTTVESSVVTINDTYLYDGTNWMLLKTGSAVTSVNGQVGDVSLDINDVSPTQTGKSGYVLGTDGFVAGWVVPEKIQRNALPQASEDELGNIYQFMGATDSTYTNGYFYKCVSDGQEPATYSWENIEVQEVDALPLSGGTMTGTITSTSLTPITVSLGGYNHSIKFSGSYATPDISLFYNIGSSTNIPTVHLPDIESVSVQAGLFKKQPNDVGYELPRGSGSIFVQASTMPTAGSAFLGNVIQFVGTTDSTYIHGHIYECVSDGQPTPTYSWTEVQLGGGSSLPDQTGQSGKFLTTDGTDASWSDKPLVNLSTVSSSVYAGSMGIGQSPSYSQAVMLGIYAAARDGCVAIGHSAEAWGCGVSIGRQAQANVNNGYSVSIGYRARTSAVHAIQLGTTGSDFTTNSDANTFKVANANGNFEMMDANGYIPAARLKNAATSPATMPTLAVADWSSNTQTVTVTGVTATNIVFVSPAPASAADYAAAGIICTAQGTDSLTFTCTTTPTNAITVNVVIIG